MAICPYCCAGQWSVGRAEWFDAALGPEAPLCSSLLSVRCAPAQTTRPACTTDSKQTK